MVISINEIKKRALEFSLEWKDESREHAESQTFWNQFFNVFGIYRRRYIQYNQPSETIDGKGFIDIFCAKWFYLCAKLNFCAKPLHRLNL